LLKQKEHQNTPPESLDVVGVAGVITVISVISTYAEFVLENWLIMVIYQELPNQAGK